ncbi:MAG: hypothetical protein ABIJ34_02995 [archaeon]
MFLRILFKKLKVREDKYLMGAIYGLSYMAIFLILITALELYLGKHNLLRNILISVIVGFTMFGLYLLKWKLFYSKTKV